MTLTATDISRWTLAADAHPVVAFAARELRTHLDRAARGGAGGNGRIVLSAGAAATDGFTATIGGDAIRLAGDNARGALNGVYWLLERFGFGWVESGERGLCFAPRAVAEGTYREAPLFALRTLTLGQDALHDDWPDWLEWASRNRCNDLFFHDTPPSVLERASARPGAADALAADGHGWLFERWDADRTAIVAAAAERGMTLQFGGHHLPALVPRRDFEAHADWFPLRGGRREARYNLCVSSPGALARLRHGAERFRARFSGADVYHLWADDIRGGGWCECAGCASLSPSDQALRATNEVAAALPGVRVAHLVYHDTLARAEATEPRENVTLLWAPRNRCYAHSIADAECPKNGGEHWPQFRELAALAGPERPLQLFEYHSDAILFKGIAPPHLATLPADLRAYAEAGATNFQDLVVGDRPWVGPPWHAWWAARCAWDGGTDAAAELGRFCELAFPGAAAGMAAYYRLLETASLALLDRHDLERSPRGDVLDYSDRPRATLTRKAAEAQAAADGFAAAALGLRGFVGEDAAQDRLRREHAQASFVRSMAGHLGARTAAWDSALAGRAAEARTLLAEAERHLADVLAWDEAWNEPAYAVITRGMRRAMRYHTDRVAALL